MKKAEVGVSALRTPFGLFEEVMRIPSVDLS